MDVAVKQVYKAYQTCYQGKGRSVQAQAYSARLIDNMFATHQALQTNTYAPKPYTCFVAANGSKPREIYAADFSDRVVHHYLVPRLEKFINPKFIYHNCANQIGKGTHFGVHALQKMLRQQKRAYNHYLQLDIHNFFYSIDQQILLSILVGHIKQAIKKHQITVPQGKSYYWLCQQIITKVRQSNPISKTAQQQIPQHKQMAYVGDGKALPIGNLTSQFFANVYMNELDQFVKHQLKAPCYVRFVDDFVLLGQVQQLRIWQRQIQQFLHRQLKLKLKPQKILKPTNEGVDFLGYIIYPHYKLVRKRVVHNFYQKLQLWQQRYINAGKINLNKTAAMQIQALVASYLGHFKHAQSGKIMQVKFKQFAWLNVLFATDSDYQYTFKTYHRQASTYVDQCDYFVRHFRGYRVLMQKGRQVEVIPPCHSAHFFSGHAARSRSNHQHSLPISQLNHYLNGLQQNRIAYIFVSQQGYQHNRLKQRKLRLVYHPQGYNTCSTTLGTL